MRYNVTIWPPGHQSAEDEPATLRLSWRVRVTSPQGSTVRYAGRVPGIVLASLAADLEDWAIQYGNSGGEEE